MSYSIYYFYLTIISLFYFLPRFTFFIAFPLQYKAKLLLIIVFELYIEILKHTIFFNSYYFQSV